MVSPLELMTPPPAPWLSMETLDAELKKAAQAPLPSWETTPQAIQDQGTHKVDVLV